MLAFSTICPYPPLEGVLQNFQISLSLNMVYMLGAAGNAKKLSSRELCFLPIWAYPPTRRKKITSAILLALLLQVFFVSCFRDLDCINLRNDLVQVSFKKESTGGPDALVLDTVLVSDLISKSPYAFKKGQGSNDSFTFPLNPTKNTQRIEFVILEQSGKVRRAIELTYGVKTQFESTDCDPKFLFYDVTVAKHDFIKAGIVKAKQQSASGQINIDVVYQ